MRIRTVSLALVLPLIFGLTTAVGFASPAQAGVSKELRLLKKINNTRANHGLRPLRLRDGISDYAERHSRSMQRAGALFHTSNFNVICCWSAIAENVGVGYSVRGLHRAFLRSTAHRANILDPGMRQIGLGVVSRDGRLWVTEVFRDPR